MYQLNEIGLALVQNIADPTAISILPIDVNGCIIDTSELLGTPLADIVVRTAEHLWPLMEHQPALKIMLESWTSRAHDFLETQYPDNFTGHVRVEVWEYISDSYRPRSPDSTTVIYQIDDRSFKDRLPTSRLKPIDISYQHEPIILKSTARR